MAAGSRARRVAFSLGWLRGWAGVASPRFDLRGHGESEGRQEELTLAAILNDILASVSVSVRADFITPDAS